MYAINLLLPLSLLLSSVSLVPAQKLHSNHHLARRHPSGPPLSQLPAQNASLAHIVPESEEDLEDVADFELLERDLQEQMHFHENRGTLVKVKSMPNKFRGSNKGIGSWFQANSGQDSTDGTSWCGIHYKNSMPLFAPKFGTMSPSHAVWANNPNQWKKDASKYCGLQATVTYKKRKLTMYIGDAFDDRWVRSPGSIDILKGSWAKLFGKNTNSKSVVMQGVQWKLTGKRSKSYSFKG